MIELITVQVCFKDVKWTSKFGGGVLEDRSDTDASQRAKDISADLETRWAHLNPPQPSEPTEESGNFSNRLKTLGSLSSPEAHTSQ